jgi:hypothetical protein
VLPLPCGGAGGFLSELDDWFMGRLVGAGFSGEELMNTDD